MTRKIVKKNIGNDLFEYFYFSTLKLHTIKPIFSYSQVFLDQ